MCFSVYIQYVVYAAFVCFVCMLMMFLYLLPAVCQFGGRELIEGDQKAVRDSSGRCLLFKCRVSYVKAHAHIRDLQIVIQHDFISHLQEEAPQ